MIAAPVLILALAAGVYLLIQVKHYGFGGIYKALAWLVVLLSLVGMGFGVARGIMHYRHMKSCSQQSGHCDMKGSEACPMQGGHCTMGGDKPIGDMGHCAMSSTGCADMPCCAKSHCAPGSSEGCCGKGTSEMKCDAGKGADKPACCQKGGAAADSTTHK